MCVVMILLEFEYLIRRHTTTVSFVLLGNKVHVNQLINKFG